MKRPNILFLMSDEHRYDVTGYEGNKVIRTPVLDKLASEGAVFKNCYTPSPICVPARQAMMMGKFCHNCNCRIYGDDLEPFSNTFANYLATYGYETVACGKLHHMGLDQMQGWTRRVNGDIEVSQRYIDIKEGYKSKPTTSMKWSDSKEVLKAGICDEKNTDDFTVEGTINYIEKYFRNAYYDRPSDYKPLLLKVSLINPHYPYFAKGDLFKYYLNRVKAYTDEEVFDHPFLSTRQVEVGGELSERDLIRATAGYYSLVEELDTNFGKVIKALEDVGQDLDDWLIIYTSDHGEMLGQHGIWEKQKFFEASAKVPLIIRAPKDFGHSQIMENVNTCDLFATLCDYIGLPKPENLDSNSLLPLMKGEEENWDNFTISHYGRLDGNNLMIKKDDLKYQYFGEEMPEVLFDLKLNPQETINYINDEKYAKEVEDFRAMLDEYYYKEE